MNQKLSERADKQVDQILEAARVLAEWAEGFRGALSESDWGKYGVLADTAERLEELQDRAQGIGEYAEDRLQPRELPEESR